MQFGFLGGYLRNLVVLLTGLIVGHSFLWAQATASGTLQGSVFDSSHAALPKADITLANPSAGFTRSQLSSESGAYRFDGLAAGTYTLTVKAPGFQTAVFDSVVLQVAASTEIDATLQPGQQSSIINVQDASPLLDTNKTDVGISITPTEVQNLPLNGRDFANLAFLAPGAKPVNSYDPTKNKIAVFGINGSSGRNVNVTVNGIDDKDSTVGGPVMQLPLEAVQEFSISTQRFSAANGRSEGAAINLITKSGSNEYHGSLFLFDRDTILNANDYFTKQANLPTSPYSRQQYGGSVGGPLKKDTLFVFFALERQRELQQLSVSANAYSELLLAKPLGAVPVQIISLPYNDQRYTGRLDWNINQNQRFSFTHNAQSNSSLNDQSTTTVDATSGNFTTNQLLLSSATLNSVISPRVVNAFTVGYQYWNNLIDTTPKYNYISFPSASLGTNSSIPQQSYQAKWQFRDDLSWTHDKHTFRMGGDFVNIPKLGGFFGNTILNFTFSADPSAILGNLAKYPQNFATPGLVTSITGSNGNPYFATRDGKMLGLYFQDDYKITRRLNLNLGLRWDKDYNLNGGNTQGQSLTYQALKKIGSSYAGGLPQNDNLDFSPRIGFAYDVTGSGHHMIRGGYGIYYGQIFENIPLFTQQQENPIIYTGTLNLTSTGPGDTKASVVPVSGGILLSNYRYGIDPLPTIPLPTAGVLPAGSTGRLLDPNYHNPYNQEFNLAYSWQLTPNDVIEFEGIHSLALRESKRVNINALDAVTRVRPLAASFAAAGIPALAQIVVESSVGRSRYDALNISYRRRMTRNFSINTNYVRSRALAYTGFPGAFNNASPNPNLLFSPSELGPSPADEPHRWVFSGIYKAPWGIQFAPIVQWASGRPYNPTEGLDFYGFGGGNGTWRAVVPTADQTNYRATAGYLAQQLKDGLANGSLTTLPYNAIRGGRFFQADLRVSKVFQFGERHRLEFIGQMFNLTNRANFGTNYTTSIRSANFGKPSGFLSTSGSIVPHAFQAELGFQYRF